MPQMEKYCGLSAVHFLHVRPPVAGYAVNNIPQWLGDKENR